jgi:hypothetical protein
MWVVHFTDKNGKATVAVCQSRDAALKSARGLRQHFCAVHYISGPNGARIELKDILEWSRSRRGTWARGKPLLRRDRDYAQRGVGLGSVSAGGFVGNKRPPRGAAL